jgi:glucose/arabinose dehydrogenase
MKFFAFILSIVTLSACGQNDPNVEASTIEYTYETITDELFIPWGFDFFPNGDIIVTEKTGEMYVIKNKNLVEIEGFPNVLVKGQGGLMDVKLHPEYPNSPWIYATYAVASPSDGNSGNTRLVRFQLSGNSVSNIEVLYQAENYSDKGQHFGSRIEFDNDGFLYFSIGDRGYRDINPQDITRDNGKIYRLNDDGSIPTSNPFYNEPNAKKAIYSYGHRNPQGMEIHPESGKIWVHEHGPRGGDEVNIVEKGKNYGWPVITYGINYSGTPITDITEKDGMEQPFHYWVPSIAPSGMAFVRSDNYTEIDGHLLVGSLKFQYVELLTIKNNKVSSRKKLLEGIGRIRSIEQGPDGYIYVGVEGIGIVKLIEK